MTSLLGAGARLVDVAGDRSLTGPELLAEVARVGEELAALPEGAVFSRTAVDLDSVLRYLGAFESGRAVALLDPVLDGAALGRYVSRFRPAAVLSAPDEPPPRGYTARDGHWVRDARDCVAPHPDLAVLLSTSGTTGEPKFVRLSRSALLANAEAIAATLGIECTDVAPTSLPLHYSFGLSVLNSHLVRGATVVIEPSGVFRKPFWNAVSEHRVTSLAGVPYHYERLRSMDFDPAPYPSLRTLTQAGGKLRTELVTHFHDAMRAVDGRLFVMYGQTEAGPRMSTVPPELLPEKLGSAGQALEGGSFSVRRDDGEETTHPKIVGEVVYRGPNVMMGYAGTEAELAHGDENGGVLATGDLGYLDEDRFLFITGRLKRIGKVFGNRVNLDDLEQAVRGTGAGIEVVAAVAADDKIVLFAEGAASGTCQDVSRALADLMHLHASGFDVRPIDHMPVLASGKIDYAVLESGL
ncbi:AMP-binding protein [Prauserella flavalba]|uniref:AMP-dependent acyl-CoA synthetase n=1 Tax=Prauserella flavalba TaxID=1477506 RepID=A0A318LVT2_9PSEU|nr:AMP-binding protein [Prauserella flavalba]PXY37595.1 AMP-dependent acyl-CoA synthetase [Prauserella flavalba]